MNPFATLPIAPSKRTGALVLVLALLVLGALPALAAAAPEEGDGTLTVSPAEPIALPTTTAGYQSVQQTVKLSYEGEGEVFIDKVTVEGEDSGEFFLNGSNCGYLAGGQSCEAWVGLKPTTVGEKHAYLVVQFGLRPSAAFALSGRAVAPQLSFTPAEYDFGLHRVNRESSGTMLELTNTGEAGVQTSSFEIVGPGHEVFWLGGGNCWGAWLEPGQSCAVQVEFGPRARTTYEAEVRATVNGSTFAAPISGRGGAAVTEALENPVGFAPTTVGSGGEVRTVTLRNVGDLPEAFFIGVLAGGDAASFRLLDENCTLVPLAPGGSCTAHVRFTPDSPGHKVARLAFFGDGEGGMMVQVEGDGVAAAATLLPSSFDFGSLTPGARSAAHAFVFRNDSASPLALDRVGLVGADVDQFALSGDECTGATLAPGGECAVHVRFAPDSAGAKLAMLRVSGPAATLSAALAGTGAGAEPGPVPVGPRRAHRVVRGETIWAGKSRLLHRHGRHDRHGAHRPRRSHR